MSDQEVKDIIAANVQRLRNGRSFSEIARLCSTGEWKCYPATIQQIEKGQHMPNAGLLSRLADGFGVTANDLLEKPRGATRRRATA